jgi:hypothetical protein
LNLIKRAGSDPELSAAAHQVLGVMVNVADTNGQIRNKSVNYFAKFTDRNRSTVIKAINLLAKRGYLERIGTFNDIGNGRNNYWLCFEITHALRANAREHAREQRAPPSSQSSSSSNASPKILDPKGHGGAETTMTVAATQPLESRGYDINSTVSSLSLPCEANGDITNPEDRGIGNDGRAKTPGAVLSGFATSNKKERHPRTPPLSSKKNTGNFQVCSSASTMERKEFARKQEDLKKAIKLRRDAEERVNKLIANYDAWDQFSEEQINEAYQAEEEARGAGTSIVEKLLPH